MNRWEDAVELSAGAVEAAKEGRELVDVPLRGPEGEAVKTDKAIEPPEGERDAVGKDEFEIAEGLRAAI